MRILGWMARLAALLVLGLIGLIVAFPQLTLEFHRGSDNAFAEFLAAIHAPEEPEPDLGAAQKTKTTEELLSSLQYTELQRQHGRRNLWSTSLSMTPESRYMLRRLAIAGDEGIDPSRYELDSLRTLADKDWQGNDRQRFNQLMTQSTLKYLTDLGKGVLNPEGRFRYWFQKPPAIDVTELAAELFSGQANVQELVRRNQPDSDLYLSLKQALSSYREIERQGGWDEIPEGPSIRPGETDDRVPLLRQRLRISGDFTESSTVEFPLNYDEALSKAVEQFQNRHGLEIDGVVGGKTLAAMNVGVAERIEQLIWNLERVRWMPRTAEQRYIQTNIPEFVLRVYDEGQEVLSMPVVTGKTTNMTPVFTDQMEYLVINPAWNVPTSIVKRELLPRERQDRGFLARSDFDVFRWKDGSKVPIDAQSLTDEDLTSGASKIALRQRPGSKNALGQVKFIFPNPHNIYLHDTQAKRLFDKHSRAFSHGCVRVGAPKTLTDTLLSYEGWNGSEVAAAFARDESRVVNFSEPLTNHIVYLTAFVDSNGWVNFRPDIYGHDTVMRSAFNKLFPSRSQSLQFADSEY